MNNYNINTRKFTALILANKISKPKLKKLTKMPTT